MFTRPLFIFCLFLCAPVCVASPTRLSGDGMMLVQVLDDKIKVTETKSGKQIHPLFAFSGVSAAAITSLTVSDDGAFVAFAAGAVRPELFHTASGRKLAIDIPENLGIPVHVAFTEHGDYLLAKTDTGSLLAWETDGGDLRVIVRGENAKLKTVGPFGVLPGDLKYIYDAPGNARSILTPQLVTFTGTPLTRVQALTELIVPEGSEVRDIAFSEDGLAVAIADKNGVTLRFRPLGGPQEAHRIEGAPEAPIEVLGVAISGRGERIAILLPGGLQVFDLNGSSAEPYAIPLNLPQGLKYASVRFHTFNAVAVVADGMTAAEVIRIPDAPPEPSCARDVAQ